MLKALVHGKLGRALTLSPALADGS
jgi:hypothetical protein